MKPHQCDKWDYALRHCAKTSLLPENKVVCLCMLCHAQGKLGDELRHTPRCCLWRSS